MIENKTENIYTHRGPMTSDDSIKLLKRFLETHAAPVNALRRLKPGVEIGLTIAGSMELALFQKEGQPQLIHRSAKNPDVIFHLNPEAIKIVCKMESADVGTLGIQVVKQIMAGSIRVTVPGSWMCLLRNGYIDIIKLGGKTFLEFLAENGLKTLSKIPDLIKNLKSQ